MKKSEKLVFPCIKITQPIGTFYIGSIPAMDLCEVTWVDVRRIEGERGFETYLGIQRPLSPRRVKEIEGYVNSPDACFPTAVILDVPGNCVTFDETRGTMTLSSYEDPEDPENNIEYRQIAKVIDGQHRIEGLRNFGNDKFEINVSIFVDMDISDQAYLFSTVNLAQTKVNRSLVYDLYELAKTRSPQKSCHEMAVALDKHEDSPFYQRIKRLGVATEGRFIETITQATFVQAMLKYISTDPMADRNLYLLKKRPPLAHKDELTKLIFRNMFINEKDLEITDVVWNYFDAVRKRWPKAWKEKEFMLGKTNGFRGLMRFLPSAYLSLGNPGNVPKAEEFYALLKEIDLNENDFTTEVFKPGTSGESLLYKTLLKKGRFTEV
jgi:DGQHR domain-containing protein